MTKTINIRNLQIGGNAPISVQSMTNTDTRDVAATVSQINALAAAGCDIVRFSVYDGECVKAIRDIRDLTNTPLVADVHFDYKLAIGAIENGIDKLRINPGNIGDEAKVRLVVSAAKAHGVAIRIGVNSGSIEREFLTQFGATPKAALMSAMKHVQILERAGFDSIVISIKMSGVLDTVNAYRAISREVDYPLHVGVTETGTGKEGIVKSAIGIGALLCDGIGDTIRVSLTGDPLNEVDAGISILRALKLRSCVDIVSCPTCGRTTGDILSIVNVLREKYSNTQADLKIAVMGCAVNGPGEAREADIGIAFAKGGAVVFRHGEKAYSGETEATLKRFYDDVEETVNERIAERA